MIHNIEANKHSEVQLLKPNWSAPAHIQAFSSTRLGGDSLDPYAGLNLGLHVGDEPLIVGKNRSTLAKTLSLPEKLFWLNQTHSTTLLKLEENTASGLTADAAWTRCKNTPCIVMTADCLPLLITDKLGTFVAAIHAGWRGLCDGIIEKSINTICGQLAVNAKDLLVWLGPCIGKNAFEVGDEVRAAFIAKNAQAEGAFSASGDRWLADLQQLARLRLAPFNVFEITASEYCTFSQSELFYSYRRDGVTGRMASLIWIADADTIGL
ncbi:MAG: YfiH family protein [Psychromonas sp.]|jgi:YfiH family protein